MGRRPPGTEFSNSYAMRFFLFKVALVGIALLMGGYNKFYGLREASKFYLGVQRVKFVLKCTQPL